MLNKSNACLTIISVCFSFALIGSKIVNDIYIIFSISFCVGSFR